MRPTPAMATLVLALMLCVPAKGMAGIACKPVLKFNDVKFSAAQNQQRIWSATVAVDASRCAATSGAFEVKFVRIKEMGPDLLFSERFNWSSAATQVSLDFWWDEAVLDYWVADVSPCGCPD